MSSNDLGRSARALGPDGAGGSVPLDGTRIVVVRQVPQVRSPVIAEPTRQCVGAEVGQFTDCANPIASQALLPYRSNAPQVGDGQGMQKVILSSRGHDDESIGFGHSARDLCEVLARSHTH